MLPAKSIVITHPNISVLPLHAATVVLDIHHRRRWAPHRQALDPAAEEGRIRLAVNDLSAIRAIAGYPIMVRLCQRLRKGIFGRTANGA
jgi:hypothetical protein